MPSRVPTRPTKRLGVRDGDDYRQLATSLLQIENEFYSTIRPKRVVFPGERPLHALRERGVQYVEVRAMDLDPFSAIGIDDATIRFLDIFLLHCLLSESPRDTREELDAVGRNKQLVAARGREPGLRLEQDGRSTELREWAAQLLAECASVASALDAAHGEGRAYRNAHDDAVLGLREPDALPSARVLREMQRSYGGSYQRFVLARSLDYRKAFLEAPLPDDVESRFAAMATESIAKQRAIEARSTVPFEEYLQAYLSHESLQVAP